MPVVNGLQSNAVLCLPAKQWPQEKHRVARHGEHFVAVSRA